MSESIIEASTGESENRLNSGKIKIKTLTVDSELNGVLKREREEIEECEDRNFKKGKIELKEKEDDKVTSVKLGPKQFCSGEDMFNYFYKFLHYWPPNVEVNKYEHMVLLDLVKTGHAEPEKITGPGIKSFHVRNHPMWHSRCFFLTKVDGIIEDFSFRKCVDKILPLPDNMKIHPSSDKNAANCIKSFDVKKFANYHRGAAARVRGGSFRR